MNNQYIFYLCWLVLSLIIITNLFILFKKGILIWLPLFIYQKSILKKIPKFTSPHHIILCIVDHFEPGNGKALDSVQDERIKVWDKEYPLMANNFRDADGKVPQHTWFYPPHHQKKFLKDLVELCKKGYGEIEMHLHHNHMSPFPDTSETLKNKILDCINEYSKYGIFCLKDGTRKFAFIHGDWSLDNSLGNRICGVNNEISILKECGCFADFTFPSLTRAQPATTNKFFYVTDDPNKAKSYNYGQEVEFCKNGKGDLLMIQGILGFRWKDRKSPMRPSIETSDLTYNDEPTMGRVDYWIKNALMIKGCPNLKFIKLHTHGAPEESWNSLFGESAKRMFEYLDSRYNDGKEYLLHYVTAREMFNIIKAVEAGGKGNPNTYRDFFISKYLYK